MKTSLKLAGAAVLAVTTLSACSSESSQYCDDLSAAQEQFESLSTNDLSSIEEAFDTFHELADQAPDEIADDWQVLDEGITTIETALEEAGLTFADLEGLQSGQLPEGVEPEDVQNLASQFSELSSQEFTDASDAIETHAQDECDVDLSSDSGSGS